MTTGIAGLQSHSRDGQDRRGYDELSGTAGPDVLRARAVSIPETASDGITGRRKPPIDPLLIPWRLLITDPPIRKPLLRVAD